MLSLYTKNKEGESVRAMMYYLELSYLRSGEMRALSVVVVVAGDCWNWLRLHVADRPRVSKLLRFSENNSEEATGRPYRVSHCELE